MIIIAIISYMVKYKYKIVAIGFLDSKYEVSKVDFQALKIFQTVAKSGSISEAARVLNYAQSNITTKIQQLEKDLQTTLFFRHNRGTTLTAKGQILLTYSEKIFRLLEETQLALIDEEVPSGPLMIGSMETTAAVRLPALLAKYHKEYPKVDFILKTGPTKQNIEDVLAYELDGAFVAGPVEHPELLARTVFEEELVLVTTTSQTAITTPFLNNCTILVFREGCSYRATFEEWLHHEGVIPNTVMEFGSLDAILGCVSAGLGISLLPRSVVEKNLQKENLSIHSIPEPYGKVETMFIFRKEGYKPSSLRKFIELLNEKEIQ